VKFRHAHFQFQGCPGLYFVGETLDCGGFKLHWAFGSGIAAAVFSGSGKNSCAEMRNTRSLPASCSTACGIPAPLASRLKGTKGSFHIIKNGRLLHRWMQQAAVLSFTVLR
jgi:hypothetical protein